MNRFVVIEKNFSPHAKDLRRIFDSRFANPLQSHADRFRWDFWHVPEQYTHLRTPAMTYFPKPLMDTFVRDLTAWGQENLGCHAISPPWLSCYVEGCEQRLHRDVPHGPFAYVYSLSPAYGRDFKGGRTMIMKASDQGFEMKDQFHHIVPRFNQLLVFDPRFLHGVERVHGTQNPRQGRLVIHGWFTHPQPWAEGPLSRGAGFEPLYDWLEQTPLMQDFNLTTGLVVIELKVSTAGHTTEVRLLQNTLFGQDFKPSDLRSWERQLRSDLKNLRFSKRKAPSRVVLPLIFD